MNLGWPLARTRREAKRAVPLVALSQLGAPAWGRRGAAALAQDGYLRNAVAYRWWRMWKLCRSCGGWRPGPLAPPVPEFGEVDLVVIDWPDLPGAASASRPLVAAWADPWPGEVDVDTWSLRGLLRSQQGSVSAAAEAGARVVLLDEAVVRASISPGEVGLAMDWPWTGHGLAMDWHMAGGEVAATLAFDTMAGLPWIVAHLRRSGDQLQWTRRGCRRVRKLDVSRGGERRAVRGGGG
jgi:hypothetical protein